MKQLRKKKSNGHNLKFQEILRDLVQSRRKNTDVQEEQEAVEEASYVEHDISIDEITQSRIHTEDYLTDTRSLRKHSLV